MEINATYQTNIQSSTASQTKTTAPATAEKKAPPSPELVRVDLQSEITEEIEAAKIQLQEPPALEFSVDDPVRRFQREQSRVEVQNLAQNMANYSVSYLLTPPNTVQLSTGGAPSPGQYNLNVQYAFGDSQ